MKRSDKMKIARLLKRAMMSPGATTRQMMSKLRPPAMNAGTQVNMRASVAPIKPVAKQQNLTARVRNPPMATVAGVKPPSVKPGGEVKIKKVLT